MTDVKLDDKGLVPAIAQDINTGQVLMLGYMNPGSLKRTVEGTQVWFYSRSQEDLWHKGEVSGNYLNLREWYVDCDADTILLKVEPDGPACHTDQMDDLPAEYEASDGGPRVLDELFAVIKDRQRAMPDDSHTAKLLSEGTSRVAQKVIEEAGEAALAAATGDTEGLPGEIADLLYHTLTLMASAGVSPNAVWEELRSRRG
ncbi:Histidine biosynthesis bifunctional protein HisIE [Geodia barretti]|uniref:Histidine biosynthesis bifunctional protein HisIE n=2 Tax=Geodia barretti TaxID=519541 RepID=A0AA35WNC6_GEOBA|nr:Histidine biosynthesis bifunctional protein HisIE [Geodia barretti]